MCDAQGVSDMLKITDEFNDSFAVFHSAVSNVDRRSPTTPKLSNPEICRLGIQRSPSAREKLYKEKVVDKPKKYDTFMGTISKLMIPKKARAPSFVTAVTHDDKITSLQLKFAAKEASMEKIEEELKLKNTRIAELERAVKELEAEMDYRSMNSNFQDGLSRGNTSSSGDSVKFMLKEGGHRNDPTLTSAESRLIVIENGVTDIDINLRRVIKVIESYAIDQGRIEEYLLHVKELHEENKKLRILLFQQQKR